MNSNFIQPVSGSIKINVPTSRVWEVISQPNNLELCHPFCESNPVEKWSGNNSIDYVNYYNGVKYQRICTNWIHGIGYDLLVGELNNRKNKVSWRINKCDDSSSELKITIYPHDMVLIEYPNFIRPFLYSLYAKPMVHKYLSSLLRGFQWYIMQGTPVQKNQFGAHAWYSKSINSHPNNKLDL